MDNIEQIKVNGTSYKVRSDLDEKIDNLGLKIYDADNDETYNIELRVENGKPVLSYTAPPRVYGVTWSGDVTNTEWVRTDKAASFSTPISYSAGSTIYGSPFDTIAPWSGMRIVERPCGTMVSIPKFYYKLTQESGGGVSIQICTEPISGFHISPAHMDRGDGKGERNIVYVGRYHCGADYKSRTGVLPAMNISDLYTNIHNLGDSVWVADYSIYFTLWMLYLVEYANWDSQTVIGFGTGEGTITYDTDPDTGETIETDTRTTSLMGYTDVMPYHTGTTLESRTTAGCSTQYRYVEGLWDNVMDVVGYTLISSNGRTFLNPADYGDNSKSINLGTVSSYYGTALNFEVRDVEDFYPMFIPEEKEMPSGNLFHVKWGSCDIVKYPMAGAPLRIGGCAGKNFQAGLFHLTKAPEDFVGARIMDLGA